MVLALLLFIEGLVLWRRGWVSRSSRLSSKEVIEKLELAGWQVKSVSSLDPMIVGKISNRASETVGGIGHFGQLRVRPHIVSQIELAVEELGT